MALKAAPNDSLEVRKAETEARAKALRDPKRVVPLVTAVDPDCVRRPLIFDNVHIPESHLDELEDV
jgi:hypothetical protein